MDNAYYRNLDALRLQCSRGEPTPSMLYRLKDQDERPDREHMDYRDLMDRLDRLVAQGLHEPFIAHLKRWGLRPAPPEPMTLWFPHPVTPGQRANLTLLWLSSGMRFRDWLRVVKP